MDKPGVTWVIAGLIICVLAVVIWVSRERRGHRGDEAARRRTAEERLQALHDRKERRRRLGLEDDEK